jgi:hypothetical protein
MLWNHKPPQSDASTQVWRDYVKQVLRKDDGRTMDKTRAQKLAQEWMLEYDMLEVDSSMTTTTSYKWKVMFENLRVRGIDTSSLRDLDNGTPGIPVVGGERYEDILQEASLIDLHISQCTPSSLEEVRLVLKYVMYHGNRLAYAEHITSNQERMCTKIENVMECGMHMDNRIGHNQFNKTVKYLVENATRVVIHDKLERISDVVVRALSHLPLEAEEAPLSATYALKYDDKKGEIEPLKLSNVRLQLVMKVDVYRMVCGIVFEGKANAEDEIHKEMNLCRLYNDMMKQLRSTKTFDEARLQILQDTMDDYCDAYIERHGNRDIFNYLHVIQAGHIRHQIRRFGNLFRYANVGFEAYIGTIRSYLTRRTQNGGNRGKKGDTKSTSARSAKRFAIRTSVNTIQTLSQDDDPLWYDNIVKVGREQLNEDRHAAVPVDDEH